MNGIFDFTGIRSERQLAPTTTYEAAKKAEGVIRKPLPPFPFLSLFSAPLTRPPPPPRSSRPITSRSSFPFLGPVKRNNIPGDEGADTAAECR